MKNHQYYEPANELSQTARTFARMLSSLAANLDAIARHEQNISLEKNKEAKSILKEAQAEDMKQFSIGLEFLMRENKEWHNITKSILFKKGDIKTHAKKKENIPKKK